MEDLVAWADIIGIVAGTLGLWVVYVLIRSDPVIIGTNATGFALNVTLLTMKIR